MSTVRAQYDTFDRWNGNQRGSSMISTGISGTLCFDTPSDSSPLATTTFGTVEDAEAAIARTHRSISGAGARPSTAMRLRPRDCR